MGSPLLYPPKCMGRLVGLACLLEAGPLGLALYVGCYLLGPPDGTPLSYSPLVSSWSCAWAVWAPKGPKNILSNPMHWRARDWGGGVGIAGVRGPPEI